VEADIFFIVSKMVDARSCCRSLVLSFLVLPGAAPLAAPPPSSPVLQLQHAVTPGKIIEVAHDHLGHLGASHISHAFYRVSKLVVSAKHSRQREGIIQDMRLMDMFSAALERVSSAGVGHQHLVNLLLACGIMEWPPASLGERADCGLRALTRALNSRADGLADHELSSIMWALEGMEQLGAVVGPTDAPRVSARLNSLNLPFRVMQRFLPDVSLESSAEGVAWARDMIELGGGVALPESRLTAWQSNDPSLCFEYSGKRMEPLPFTPGVDRCRLILKEETGVEYDAVLLNLYPSGAQARHFIFVICSPAPILHNPRLLAHSQVNAGCDITLILEWESTGRNRLLSYPLEVTPECSS
jgi:hypothetical protein